MITSQKNILMSESVKKQVQSANIYRLTNGAWEDIYGDDPASPDLFHIRWKRLFNAHGDLLEEIEFDEDGTELQKTINEYDSANRLIKSSLFDSGNFAESTIFEYNDKGQLVKESRSFEEGYPVHVFYSYNGNAMLIEKRTEDDDKELERIETFEYHPEWTDQIVVHRVYDEENTLTQETLTQWELRDEVVKAKELISEDFIAGHFKRTEFFDPRKRQDSVGFVSYDRKGKVLEVFKIKFDEHGNEIEEKSESVVAGDNFTVTYEHDESGRVTRQIQIQGDKIISDHQRLYNDNGDAHVHAFRSPTRGIFVERFEYVYF
jgi:hypothetical protein